mmetsp:Transcript_1692/g.4728  ORF Transcript_1692/g.4728 Transcript_1692/m.4728 type:complete len:137 (-) Transcript_1692:65-475(-)
MRYTRTCCLTTGEKKLLEGADELFMKVNPDVNSFPASCCVIETLGKAETMLLLRVIRDEKHHEVRQYRELLDDFASKIKEAAGEDTDGGRAITQDEFAGALITALNDYMASANEKVSNALTAEYEEMEREIGGGPL